MSFDNLPSVDTIYKNINAENLALQDTKNNQKLIIMNELYQQISEKITSETLLNDIEYSMKHPAHFRTYDFKNNKYFNNTLYYSFPISYEAHFVCKNNPKLVEQEIFLKSLIKTLECKGYTLNYSLSGVFNPYTFVFMISF